MWTGCTKEETRTADANQRATFPLYPEAQGLDNVINLNLMERHVDFQLMSHGYHTQLLSLYLASHYRYAYEYKGPGLA